MTILRKNLRISMKIPYIFFNVECNHHFFLSFQIISHLLTHYNLMNCVILYPPLQSYLSNNETGCLKRLITLHPWVFLRWCNKALSNLFWTHSWPSWEQEVELETTGGPLSVSSQAMILFKTKCRRWSWSRFLFQNARESHIWDICLPGHGSRLPMELLCILDLLGIYHTPEILKWNPLFHLKSHIFNMYKGQF